MVDPFGVTSRSMLLVQLLNLRKPLVVSHFLFSGKSLDNAGDVARRDELRVMAGC